MSSKPRYSPGDLVEVKWRDACSYSRWIGMESLRKPVDVEEFIGYVVQDRQDEFLLSMERVTLSDDESATYGTVWRIPKGCIISITRGTFKPDKKLRRC